MSGILNKGIIQDFLDDIKWAKAEGLQRLEHMLIFPKLFDGNKDHLKVVKDDNQITVEQVYSSETVKCVFDAWYVNQRQPVRWVVEHLRGKLAN